jgi:uncharacterized membrane protein
MTSARPGGRTTAHFWRHTLIGLLTIAPLWVTWLVFDFVLGVLYRTGAPAVLAVAGKARPFSEALADLILEPSFRFVLAVLATLVTLYALGWAASRVIGRRLIARLESLLQRIPVVQVIYGATKRFIASVSERPEGFKRVVLINFPSPPMKTIGFVTRIMTDGATGQEVAAVYVPTAPNPTSGYIEIVPLAELTAVDWTVEEAMSFVMTAGTSATGTIPFSKPMPPGAA